jgi:hypothetical protein
MTEVRAHLRFLLATVAVVLLSMGVGACGGGGDATEVAHGSGYEVTLPGGWDVEKEKPDALGFKVDSLWVGDTVEGFRVNVNVVRETSLARNLSLRDYVGVNQRGLKDPEAAPKGFKSSAIEQPRRTTLGGQEAFRFGWVNTAGVTRLRVDQVFALRRGVGYILTYSAPADRYRDQLDDFEEILDSWRWK